MPVSCSISSALPTVDSSRSSRHWPDFRVFVVVDLTDPRVVYQEMDRILLHYPSIPVRPILEEGRPVPVTLADHAHRRALVMPVYRYRDKAQILDQMKEHIIDPAEARAAEL